MQMEIIPGQGHYLLPPTHILDGLTVIPGTSRFQSSGHYVEELERFIMDFPNMIHLVGGIGEPLSGKLSVVTEIMALLTYPGSNLRQFARENGYQIRKYLLTWGDPFDFIQDKDLPSSMTWEDKSRIQTPQAVPIFFESLAETIKGYDKPRSKVIRLVGYDAVAHTGMKFEGDREYGLDRANREMEELAQHAGPFKGLEYSDWRFGIGAVNQVRADNMQFRAAILGARNEEERKGILKIYNKSLILNEQRPLAEYGADEASVENTLEIEDEMNDLVLGLLRHGLIDLSQFGAMTCAEDLKYGPLASVRDKIIAGVVNPVMFKQTRANYDTSVHFLNERKAEETVVLNLKGYRYPVRDLRGGSRVLDHVAEATD